MRALRTEPKPEFKMSWDQSSMSKVTKNNNETISTIKAAPKVKTKEGQARSHALNNPATLESRAVDKYAVGKDEDLRTKSVITELIGRISRNTKFKTERWLASKELASKYKDASTRPCKSES